MLRSLTTMPITRRRKGDPGGGRNYPHRKLWCVFQPHTYTRTRAFLDQFAKLCLLQMKVVLADIYAARGDRYPGGQFSGCGGPD